MSDINKAFEAAIKKSPNDQKKELLALLKKLNNDSTRDPKKIISFLELLLGGQASGSIQAAILDEFSSLLAKFSNDEVLIVVPPILPEIAKRIISLEEQDLKIRIQLADTYSAKGQYANAARSLTQCKFDPQSTKISAEQKTEVYIKISEYMLWNDNSADAYTYINKAAHYVHEITNIQLQLRYQVCYTTIEDANRKFASAALSYHDLSLRADVGVAESDLIQLLEKAVTCAILASAGPQRSRILALLYKDERSKKLKHSEILEKMFMDKFIRLSEVKDFEEGLESHQKSKTPDNYTVLTKAVLEHNIVAISKLYKNISFTELGNLLEIPPKNAETLVANMIGENRIKAKLDQLKNRLYFESDKENIQILGDQINSTCHALDELINETLKEYPDLAQFHE